MKKCSYCGSQNEDAAVSCPKCGTGALADIAAEVDPQLKDPAGALVIVETFDSMAQASLLATLLEATGIEACIPEEYAPQTFSNVIPLGSVTVRVAAKDFEAAKAIAVGRVKTGPSSVIEGPVEAAADAVGQGNPSIPRGPAVQAIRVISAIAVVVPILCGLLVHTSRESAAMGPLFWLWALFSIVCFFWGRYVFRRYRLLAWGCVAVGMLQLISFLVLFAAIDFPVNTRNLHLPPTATRNRHDW